MGHRSLLFAILIFQISLMLCDDDEFLKKSPYEDRDPETKSPEYSLEVEVVTLPVPHDEKVWSTEKGERQVPDIEYLRKILFKPEEYQIPTEDPEIVEARKNAIKMQEEFRNWEPVTFLDVPDFKDFNLPDFKPEAFTVVIPDFNRRRHHEFSLNALGMAIGFRILMFIVIVPIVLGCIWCFCPHRLRKARGFNRLVENAADSPKPEERRLQTV